MPVLSSPAKSLCILRLSAVGDICHSLPVLRSIQAAWPETRITWVIGRSEYQLVKNIEHVEFIVFDKKQGWKAYWQLRKQLKGRCFDVLLHMQMSMRASIASLFIPAAVKLGFDRERAKDFQWLFSNAKIESRKQQHVIDSFFGFVDAIGISQHTLAWDIPQDQRALASLQQKLPGSDRFVVISPCSAMAYRNWSKTGYAEVADALSQRGYTVILSGGPSQLEKDYGDAICRQSQSNPINLIGQTSLQELLILLDKASFVISPDSGPAHLATAVGTPVVGLYACTNPDRARPYLSAKYVVNRYPEAVQDKYHDSVDNLPWGIRVRDPGTMERISVADVLEKVDLLIADLDAKG